MDFKRVLEYIYPDIKDIDYSLRDDGQGVYIDRWNYEKPIPTEQELLQAWETVKKLPYPPPPPTLEERVKILEEKVKALENA